MESYILLAPLVAPLVLAASAVTVLLEAYEFIRFRIGQDLLRSTLLNSTQTQPPAKNQTLFLGDPAGVFAFIPRDSR